MNGPSHYTAAEKILEVLGQITKEQGGVRVDLATGLLAEAQVHATLAQAAATATLASLLASHAAINHTDIDAWDDATATPEEPARCDCGQPIPAGRKATCSPQCRFADDDHGPETDGGGAA